MLAEYKQLYEENIKDKDLDDIDKNELIRKYVSTHEEMYLSAAICKFWYILKNRLSKNINNKFIEPEDFYSLYIDSILDTCKNKVWEKEGHILYGDERAPEKSINTIFNSKIINYFHACNRQKRKTMFEKVSFNGGEYVVSIPFTGDVKEKKDVNEIVADFFYRKDYYSAYILDLILNEDVFEMQNGKNVFNKKRLKHYLMSMDDSYYDYFSKSYDIEKERVDFSRKYTDNISYEQADREILRSLRTLYANKDVIDYVRSRGE